MLSGHPLKSSIDHSDSLFAQGSGLPPAPSSGLDDPAPPDQDFNSSLNSAAGPKSESPTPAGPVTEENAKAGGLDPSSTATGRVTAGKTQTESVNTMIQAGEASAKTSRAKGSPKETTIQPAENIPSTIGSIQRLDKPSPSGHPVPVQARLDLEQETGPVGARNKLQEPILPPARFAGNPHPQSATTIKHEGATAPSSTPRPSSQEPRGDSPGVSTPPGPSSKLPGVAPSSAPATPSPAAPHTAHPQALAIGGQAAHALAQTRKAAGAKPAQPQKLVPPTTLRFSSGTDGAKSTPRMHGSEKKSQERPAIQQTLPGQGTPLPTNPRQSGQSHSGNGAAFKENQFFESTRFTGDLPALDPASLRPPGTLPPDGLRHLGGASSTLTAVEEIQLRITNGAMELRAARADSMSVVLRPDGRTELTIHLKLQNGLVEVEARMQRGDWGTLQAQWGQLQQSLSQQGIRLSSLAPQDPHGNQGQDFSDPNRPTQYSDKDQNSHPFQDRPGPGEQEARHPTGSETQGGSRATHPQDHPLDPTQPANTSSRQPASATGFWESWA